MTYTFKVWHELMWVLLVAVVPVLLQALVTFDPATIPNYQEWGLNLTLASVRAIAGGLIALWGKIKTQQ